MRKTHPNKQGSGPVIPSTAPFSNSDEATSAEIIRNTSRRRRSLALGENLTTHRSLQGDELRAHLGIHSTPPLTHSFQQYENAYEKARGGLAGYEGAQVASSVFGSQEPNAKVSDRRKRLSMGSQLELIQTQLEVQTQPRPKSFVTFAEPLGRDDLVTRTAPSSRSNSASKVRPCTLKQNPFPHGTVRTVHFDRVSESMPNFKPGEVKPDFCEDSSESSFTNGSAHNYSKFNHLPSVGPISKSESHSPVHYSPKGKQSTPTKYLSARAVAERLAKAIRGGSKSSKNKVDLTSSLPRFENQDTSYISFDVSGGKAVDQWPEVYSRQFTSEEQALDHSGFYADFNEKSQMSYFRDKKIELAPPEKKEIDVLKRWLEGMKQQGEGVYDDLEKKAQATCERLELLNEEQALVDDQLLSFNDLQFSDRVRNTDLIAAAQQRFRKMHEEKKFLALEAASELKRRISERAAARKVFTLMKREMDAYANVMEKEKSALQSKLEEEIARRESSWVMKLDRIRAEERGLRERIKNLQEENSHIQKEKFTLSSRDGNIARIRELESQVDSHRTRAEQAEAELNALQEVSAEREAETRNLRKIVERLPVLCGDYEKHISTTQQSKRDGRVEDMNFGRKPSSLQREITRLSSLEVALRSEMQVLKRNSLNYADLEDEQSANGTGSKHVEELRTELDRLQKQSVELQDENNLLSLKLRLALREKEDMRRAFGEAENEVHKLQNELGLCQREGNQRHGSESRADGSHELEGDADVQLLELEGRQQSQGKRFVNGLHTRAEALNDRVQVCDSQLLTMKHEFAKQEDITQGLEHSLSVAGKTIEAQKVRITRLSARNEELLCQYHGKESEVQDLRVLSSAEAEGRRVCEQELSQMREQSLECKHELRSQDLQYKLLKEHLSSTEAELEQRTDEVTALEQRRDWLEAEMSNLHRLLAEEKEIRTTLESQCEDQKEKIKTLQLDVNGHFEELSKLKDQLPRVLKDRDELSHEAEQMGREALKLSAEVEVLRRRVHELDEDVMVRDGQISILCNTLEDRE